MKLILLSLSTALSLMLLTTATANPIVAPGGFNPNQVNIQQHGNNTVINQSSQVTHIRWNKFNIGKSETTTFNQPNKSSVAINRVNAANGVSEIYGTLKANGRIVLINQAGVYFAPGSFVNVGSIIASTSDMTKFDKQKYVFDIPSKIPGAAIINRGTIQAADYGLVALIGNRVENSGNITARAGTVVMGAGNKFTLDFVGDQLLNFSIDEPASNSGSAQDLKDLGTVHVSPVVTQKILDRVVNTRSIPEATHFAKASNGDLIFSNGKIDVSAKSPGQRGGKVKLLAKRVKVENAVIDASGDAGGGEVLIGGNYQGKGPELNATTTSVKNTTINASALNKGDGGKVIVWADDRTTFNDSTILAQGGTFGGDGGLVETSGKNYLNVDGARVDTRAPMGKTGSWLLDPTSIYIAINLANASAAGMSGSDTSASTITNGTSQASGSVDDSLLTVDDLETALETTNVIVTTANTSGAGAGDIYVVDPISWSDATTLTLSAYRNIELNANITNSNVSGTTVNLQADNTGTGTGTVLGSGIVTTAAPGTINIYYNPTNYTSPTNFSGNVSGGTLNAYMLVNQLGTSSDAATVKSLGAISNNSSLWGQNFALGKDIDASATSGVGWNAGTGWSPIGNDAIKYTGKFDGQNHVIDSLYMNKNSIANEVGFFGIIGSVGVVQNLGLTNANFTVIPAFNRNVGVLAGQNLGYINNSYTTGTLVINATTEWHRSGGLAGTNSTTIASADCSITNSCTINNSYSSVNVTDTTTGNAGFAIAGGLVGFTWHDSIVLNSYATGNVQMTLGAGANVGFVAIGGLVGQGAGISISNSYSTGNVIKTGSGTSSALVMGGLIGAPSPIIISDVFSTGYVSTNTAALGIGGLVGDSGVSVTNSFWNTDATTSTQTLTVSDPANAINAIFNNSGDPLTIVGNVTFGSGSDVTGDVNIVGSTNFLGPVTISNNATTTGTLTYGDTVTLTSNAVLNASDIVFNADINAVNYSLTLNGDTTFDSSNINIGGDLNVTGSTIFNNDVNITAANTTFNGLVGTNSGTPRSVTINGNAIFNSDIGAYDNGQPNTLSSLTVTGNVTLGSNIITIGSLGSPGTIVGGGNSSLNISGFGSPQSIAMASNNSGYFPGYFKDTSSAGTLVSVPFSGFTSIIGPASGGSSIQLPATGQSNMLIFKPVGGAPTLAQLNSVFNFDFSQFTTIYGVLGNGDIADLRNVLVNNPGASFIGNSITYSISDPILVTFVNFDFLGIPIPSSSSSSINADTLVSGNAQASQAEGNAAEVPASDNTSTAQMLATTTEALDTAFGNTEFAPEDAGGGCPTVNTSAASKDLP